MEQRGFLRNVVEKRGWIMIQYKNNLSVRLVPQREAVYM